MGDSATPAADKPETGIRVRIRRLAQFLSIMAVWAVLCFGGAGRLNWLRGWVWFVIYGASMSVTAAVVHRFNPDLFQARARWRRKDTKKFDRIFLSIFAPLIFLQILVAGMDAGRFGWMPLPRWTLFPGVALLLAATTLVTWVLAVNPFAETSVRVQEERGQRVISAGPYRLVRHPMYVGLMLTYLANALMLGSGWAAVIGAAISALLVWRTFCEDNFLRGNLAGYSEYAARTRFRLVPGLW